MLIRSQNKEILINFNNAPAIQIMETDGDAIIACSDTYETYTIGFYSTKAKAMKVLDMIQEVYADAELTQMTIPNIGKMFAEAPASKENKLLVEAIEKTLMNKMVFQMPEDSEVEV